MGGLLPKAPKSAPAPVIAPPTAMPDPDDELLRKQRRKQAAAQQSLSGRASTILSDTSGTTDRLGG